MATKSSIHIMILICDGEKNGIRRAGERSTRRWTPVLKKNDARMPQQRVRCAVGGALYVLMARMRDSHIT